MPVPTINVLGIELPGDIQSLETFRAWMAALPDSGPRLRATYCSGEVFVEMSPQDYETHGPLAIEINRVLGNLTRETGVGRWFMPPSWFTDAAAGLSTEPDGFLVRFASVKNGRVRINPERKSEMLGAPDMVLEVVSKSSRRKDLVSLEQGYARAGVAEYWTADARGDEIVFRILVLGADVRYAAQPTDAQGFLVSPTFGRSFRIARVQDEAGWTDFRLDVR